MTKVSAGKNVETEKPHWIEWVAGAVSVLLVLVVIGWIGKDALADRDTAPDLVGRVLRVEQKSQGFQVDFEIRNNASFTASQVKVRGEISGMATPTASAETILDYVPGQSNARGGLIFASDPAGRKITIRATAFNEP